MTGFQALAAAAGLTALCGVFAVKILRVRGSLGVATSGAILSLAAYAAGAAFPAAEAAARELILAVDFKEAVFHGLLCFLLFAGAMHVDLARLKSWGWHVALLATVGVALSAVLVAAFLWLATAAIGVEIPFLWLLAFGALISPTDPIAVLALLKKVGAPEDLETKIASESLFNDGTGVVLFAVVVELASGASEPSIHAAGALFAREALGGLLLGAFFGAALHALLKSLDDAATETAVTLAGAVCVFALGEALHVSAALAVAVCGLLVGNGKKYSMSPETRSRLLPFWEMFDEILNMALFALVGLAMMAADFSWTAVAFGFACALAALLARLISVAAGIGALSWIPSKVLPGTIAAMTWGGLRGGLSLAMALSLPESPFKSLIVAGAWIAVMFSLLIQAPLMPRVLRRFKLVD